MSNQTQYWDARRKKIFSGIGGWRVGEGVFLRGHDVLEELLPNQSFFQYMLLAVTGELAEVRFAQWCEAAFMCLSWPDPRIWCNQIGALSAETNCSTVAATAAGTLANDSDMYGARSGYASTAFIAEALRQHNTGMSAKEIIDNEVKKTRGRLHVKGYARPVAKGDERVAALQKRARELQFPIGAHEKLAFEIEDYLMEKFRESMNVGGYMGAFWCDQGYTPQQSYQFTAMIVFSGVNSCHMDNLPRPPGSFLPLRCDDVEYTGKPLRELPRQ